MKLLRMLVRIKRQDHQQTVVACVTEDDAIADEVTVMDRGLTTE